MHIMIANPEGYVPKVYDFWFEEPELRYFATEKDCQTKGAEILKWARKNMKDKNLCTNILRMSSHHGKVFLKIEIKNR